MEAAKFLGIKVSCHHKLMMRRFFPYYKPNGKFCVFDKADTAIFCVRLSTTKQNISKARQLLTEQGC